uniref:EF-hand domain-containing protein n=1 Tax=Polytomella parva TaxID=51329 RepID=A0A7S0UV11_9CHLO|mmetsp:Transcript_19196/g.34736  ORF Transcript_19196/g.34736 Transcript_19196/m.34736 type:complete len:153 (+) Transcript_19196:98-556(+)|eukprot:CAMPEP_0175045666 /NCGR_PEP_ID=MMETSP0052_2-20121109/4570_1 /TAXON_ID=51329 ORGANISM="Polytomella parva, Strain SAG 63-3" /NCGR_SAMPLE_ID=MMETSP0052_2 /ASSEMBLY_ACC=CAM_ASM_000194 /LENGTH=152 /DNA_ID=CAMNT_0016309263 /DNA_START=27 /DNA_END=485 /DNA_ORIENTATION=+
MPDLPKLTDEELELCRKAFSMFDKDGSGTIDVRELKTALSALGQNPTDEELFVMISKVDEDGSKEIEFPEFVKVIQINKSISEKNTDEQDTLDAFVALGGNPDMTGKVSVEKLKNVCEYFELNVNLDKILNNYDVNGVRNDIEFEDFRAFLS